MPDRLPELGHRAQSHRKFSECACMFTRGHRWPVAKDPACAHFGFPVALIGAQP